MLLKSNTPGKETLEEKSELEIQYLAVRNSRPKLDSTGLNWRQDRLGTLQHNGATPDHERLSLSLQPKMSKMGFEINIPGVFFIACIL